MTAEPCRYAAVSLEHQCVRNTGEPVKPGEVCFYEAAAQLRDSGEAGEPITDPGVYRMIAQASVAGQQRKVGAA